jgi:alkylhydroperoxidase/carboxymuconolactone decarboxylase family protein YurZ
MVDRAMEAAYRRGLARKGELVTVKRLSGTAPRTVFFSAENILAAVENYTPDTAQPSESGYGASQPGGLPETDRRLIFMASDLAKARFPLPLQKHDKIVLANGELLDVTGVDDHQRQLAGAIVVTAAGVR